MTVHRNRQYALVIATVASLFLIASIIAAAVREGDLTTSQRVWPVVPVLVLSAFCLLRLARAGVYAGPEGIRVLNPLRTVKVPWEHVLRFTLEPHKGFPAVGFAELIDGRRIQIWGIQSRSSNAAAKRIPQQEIDALNERLREVRAGISAAA